MSKYDRYNQAFVDLIKEADKAPPERYVRTLDELIKFLEEEDEAASKVTNGERV